MNMSGLLNNMTNGVVKDMIGMDTKMACNNTCCTNSKNHTLCFGDYNFTEQVNLTSPEQWELGVRWSYTILVLLVGFFGNLSIIIILARNRLLLRTSVNHFILNMSVADLLTSLAGPVPFTIRDTNELWVLGEVWCHLEGYIQVLVMLVSVTSLAVISFDRMLGVVRPFHQHLKKRQSMIIIVIIWVLSAVIAVPFALYRVYSERVWADMTEVLCGEDDDKMSVWWAVTIIVLCWLPLLIMVISYTTIFICFKLDSFKLNNNKEHPGLVHMKKRVIRMMFVVVIAFTIGWLPFQILTVDKKHFIDDSGHYVSEQAEESYHILFSVAHYMMYTNTAINPIIYALMHQNFRRAFRVTFPCIFKTKSELVLTRGQGRQNYVWSVRSTASNVYGAHVVNQPKKNLKDRLTGTGTKELTPSALLNTSAIAASIVLEPRGKECQKTEQREDHSMSFSSMSISDEFEEHIPIKQKPKGKSEGKSLRFRLPKIKIKDKKKSTGATDCNVEIKVVDTELEDEKMGLQGIRTPSYANETFVRDLVPRRFSIRSTGALGDLITQVIVEESSTELESERIL